MRKTGRLGFLVATIFFVLVAAFSIVGTVKSRTVCTDEELDGYYREMEQQVREETTGYLEKQGLFHSGIMINHVVEADGSREYRVTIHHGEIDKMNEEERIELAEELALLAYADENCIFYHEFLIND